MANLLSKYIVPGRQVDLQAIERSSRKKQGEGKKIHRSQVLDILSEDQFEIAMPMEEGKLILLPVDGEYNLYIHGETALYQCIVRVADRYKNHNRYVLVLDLLTNLRKHQRREYYRFSCALEMNSRQIEEEQISAADKEGMIPELPLKRSVIVDISGGGLRFVANYAYDAQSMIMCKYHLMVEGEIKEFNLVGKVLDEKGDGSTESMLRGLDWILRIRKQCRVRILNISVGIGTLEEAQKEQQLKAMIEEVWDSGILVVCAAGNKGPDPGTISAVGGSSKAVTVGCHDGRYEIDSPGRCETYSGRGVEGAALRKPDLVAPGTDIVSCNIHYYRLHGKFRNAYTAKSGTSMATPIVSGAAALAMQKFPQMTNEECKRRLQYTARDLHLPWNQQDGAWFR
mgnify:CR=1 FL=1